jgi:hypothetical protein
MHLSYQVFCFGTRTSDNVQNKIKGIAEQMAAENTIARSTGAQWSTSCPYLAWNLWMRMAPEATDKLNEFRR